jgi:tetratricopeptide (TPR) repeat protein
MAQGEFALINQHLSAAMQKPPIGWNPVGEHEILVLMADTAALQHEIEALSSTAERAELISRQLGHQLYQAVSLRALASLHGLKGNYPAAEAHLLEALAIFQKLETRWQAGRTWLNLAEVLAAQGRKHEAVECYNHAIGEFEAMQAKPSIDLSRAALSKLISAAP